MPAANLEPVDDGTTVVARAPLFKEDRPRHIDRFISFFGEEGEASPRSEPASFDTERWPAEA